MSGFGVEIGDCWWCIMLLWLFSVCIDKIGRVDKATDRCRALEQDGRDLGMLESCMVIVYQWMYCGGTEMKRSSDDHVEAESIYK